MIAKSTPAIAPGPSTAGAVLRARRQRVRRQPPDGGSHNERVRLITFVWSGRTGDQPVVFAERSWLQ